MKISIQRNFFQDKLGDIWCGRKSVNDAVSERLNYSGASDFVNGENSTVEYVYENGNLVKSQKLEKKMSNKRMNRQQI